MGGMGEEGGAKGVEGVGNLKEYSDDEAQL